MLQILVTLYHVLYTNFYFYDIFIDIEMGFIHHTKQHQIYSVSNAFEKNSNPMMIPTFHMIVRINTTMLHMFQATYFTLQGLSES